ncbi:MAG: EAL domain-containing protein [Gammaproteobacteria bacterium]
MSDHSLRLLIIDDNLQIHSDFIKILATKNADKLELLEESLFGEKTKKIELPQFIIDTAAQGQEGVKYIAQAKQDKKPYALAFVDIRMPPGWDGIETIKHIWEIDPDIQIVICSAYSDYSWEETAEHLGQNENLLILRKPFDHVSVRQLACALTKKWQLMQESRSYTKNLEARVQERTKKIEYQATHDLLTGLPNRAMMIDRIKKEINIAQREKSEFAIFFFDLDRFKLINDSFGHGAGDSVLKSVTTSLSKALRENDMLGRIGGDEFVGIFSPVTDKKIIKKITVSLLKAINVPLKVKNHEIIISTSIGIAVFPGDGNNTDELLRNADMAMYRAKELGGNQFQFYTSELAKTCFGRLELETDLHRAINENELFLVYQPQYDLAKNQFVSVEALVRWEHPKKGTLLPIDFIPLAEETGLINTIGTWVLETACKQNKYWQEMGLPKVRVAVNITSKQFKQPDVVACIKKIIDDTGLAPNYLELELTENIILNHIEAPKKISELRKMGIYIALDDFGTGYSSLNYLRNIPLDRLKIDQSFIQNISHNRDDEIIIQAIITMAHGLNLEVVAEGVETQSQLDFLKSKKCGEIQGFYFSKPLSSHDFETLLQSRV